MVNNGGASFSTRILQWYDHHGRTNLPWQQDVSPYRVWISEIMLQQTRVQTVIPYFERFMQRFPSVHALAGATEDEVLHLWTGLGYYARARNLHKTARIISDDHRGKFPDTVNELCELPGIGRSTAGAVVSIAGGRRAPILDGNVKRVLARCFGIEGWPGQSNTAKQLWQKAEELTPDRRVADYTQAIMDLGATLCVRAAPNCAACPMESICVANRGARVEQLPGKKPRKAMPIKSTCMLLVENAAAELLLEKRDSRGVWGGLWSFPECAPGELDETLANFPPGSSRDDLSPFRHTFTHFHLDITPVHINLPDTADYEIREASKRCWYSLTQPVEIGLAGPVTKLINELRR
ncbi:MAG: A/G-specific adenine glycosylase [Pseudomonadales bacterium]